MDVIVIIKNTRKIQVNKLTFTMLTILKRESVGLTPKLINLAVVILVNH